MHYKAKNVAALKTLLGGWPDRTRVECEPGLGVSARTVGDLRKVTAWPENLAVIELARDSGKPLVSGGDRHGCEPNSIVNLTRSVTFSGFVSEVRAARSEILLLDHYREPRRFRAAWRP